MPSAFNSTTPTGTIQSFGGTVAPSGWLLCNTATPVSRTTYAALFAVVGTAFGSGDGSTTFNIPDLRGRFLRGVDGGSARDPDAAGRTAMNAGGNTGNNVGSVQLNQTSSHFHEVGFTNTPNVFGTGTTALGGIQALSFSSLAAGTAQKSGLTGGNETRPLNAYANYIIKY